MNEGVIKQNKQIGQRLMMAVSFLLAVPLAGVLLIYPNLMFSQNGEYSHNALMLVMIGISSGFVYGIGFIPHFWVWKWLFSPWVGLPLMLYGYYLWFLT